ncbi:MAG: hypothetical protein J6S76_02265 [Clostridia bacterium]|nr:hypothetical protein [Clostridia bacterium]
MKSAHLPTDTVGGMRFFFIPVGVWGVPDCVVRRKKMRQREKFNKSKCLLFTAKTDSMFEKYFLKLPPDEVGDGKDIKKLSPNEVGDGEDIKKTVTR